MGIWSVGAEKLEYFISSFFEFYMAPPVLLLFWLPPIRHDVVLALASGFWDLITVPSLS
jgi:hypothetical protein